MAWGEEKMGRERAAGEIRKITDVS